MSGSEAERSEAPSPKRLEEARRKGDGPRSTELTVALTYLGAAIFLAALGPSAFDRMGGGLAAMLEAAARGDRPGADALVSALAPAAALVALPAALVVAGLAAQRTVVFAPAKLVPKISRISILSNAKQKFGPTGLFEFAKAAVKLGVVCALVAMVGVSGLPALLAAPALGERAAAVMPFPAAARLVWPMVGIAALLAGADLLWQRFDFERRNKMSMKELRDEAKESEGDPQLKAKRRARAEQIASRRMLADVPKADVVVMNPTHYAVALCWSRAPGTAPVCVAKGFDDVAMRIRETAKTAGVPVRVDPPLARALHAATTIGQEVPPQTWEAVAALIRYADRMRAHGRRA
ncbi:MAG: EscU/YscU/HrcU family type III secretion system export apparatus switch protein [Hasllibacter sp.]